MLTYVFVFAIGKELRANISFWKGFRGAIKDSAVSLRPLNTEAKLFRYSFVLKITFLRKNYVVEVFLSIPRSPCSRQIRFYGLIKTAESASMVSLNRRSRPFLTNISNFSANPKPYAETALARESGPQGGLIDDKNWGSKISWHCTFIRTMCKNCLMVTVGKRVRLDNCCCTTTVRL
jgi:hypothetical protein